jgi:hypothetical protein
MLNQTLQVVKQLANGKTIKINGYKYVMLEDMTICPIGYREDGTEIPLFMGEVNLRQLNSLLDSLITIPEII